MSCIHDDMIQKYIDGETNSEEAALVENHVSTCKKCGIKIENQRRLATSINKAINLLAKDPIEIPDFVIPSGHIKKPSFRIIRFSCIIAAACILLFVIFITDRKEMKSQVEIIPEAVSGMDIDANRPVSQFPLIVNIIDNE